MKKLGLQVSGILLLVGWLAAPALARDVYKSSILCPSIESSDTVSINTHGDVKIVMKGLWPDAGFFCAGFCRCGGPSPFFSSFCTADSKGNLNVTFEEAAAGDTCQCPSVEFFVISIPICASGFSEL
jgi:hypothetical protein